MLSEQFAKLFIGQTCVPHDSTHGDSVDQIMSWNDENMHPVGHHTMFPRGTLPFRGPGQLAQDSCQAMVVWLHPDIPFPHLSLRCLTE